MYASVEQVVFDAHATNLFTRTVGNKPQIGLVASHRYKGKKSVKVRIWNTRSVRYRWRLSGVAGGCHDSHAHNTLQCFTVKISQVDIIRSLIRGHFTRATSIFTGKRERERERETHLRPDIRAVFFQAHNKVSLPTTNCIQGPFPSIHVLQHTN